MSDDRPSRSTAHAKPGDEPNPTQPNLTKAGREAKADREARLAEALRANLHRRKTQTRSRTTPGDTNGDDPA